jgi:hypothetical protein
VVIGEATGSQPQRHQLLALTSLHWRTRTGSWPRSLAAPASDFGRTDGRLLWCFVNLHCRTARTVRYTGVNTLLNKLVIYVIYSRALLGFQ